MPKHENDLFDRLTGVGLRRKTARKVSDAVHAGRKPPSQITKLVSELRAVTSEIEGRLSDGSAKRKAAAQKAAKTRKRNQAARVTAARKGSRTRKSRSGS